jgi:hypothetical protein
LLGPCSRRANAATGDVASLAIRNCPYGGVGIGAGKIRLVGDLLADVRRVRQVADVFGPASTALSMRKVAERALEHDDEDVRRLANQLLAELERSPALRRRR